MSRRTRGREAGCDPAPTARRRVPDLAGRDLSTLTLPGHERNLTEMLSGLLDNAGKWAHRRVFISVMRTGLAIEEDGRGIS